MRNWRKVVRMVPRYTSRFGLFHGIRIGLSTILPKVLPHGHLCAIRLPSAPHPLWLRARTSDVKVFHQVFVEGDHNVRLRRSPRVIVDAGANIGVSSVHFARTYPDATVVAVEPDPENYAMLLRNTAPFGNIRAIRGALWSHRTTVSLRNPSHEEWAVQVTAMTEPAGDAVQAYDLLSLLDAVGAGPVELLKVDIEGAETEVFGDPTQSWLQGLGVVMIEFHDYLRPGCRATVCAALAAHGYSESAQGEYSVFAAQGWTEGENADER
jgi:FkbM family methyltransferase